jgi:hypothetical protein
MTRNTKKHNPTRQRKGKSRDTSIIFPNNVNSFLGIIHSAADHTHYNVEIMIPNTDDHTWTSSRTTATLMKGGRRSFFNKSVPRPLTDRIILVERTGLSRQSSSVASEATSSRELNIIVYCYTIEEIRQLKAEDYLPPNITSYMESTQTSAAPIQLGGSENYFEFEEAEEMEVESEDEGKGENDSTETDDEEDDMVNPNSSINPTEATTSAIAAAMAGIIGRKKKSGKSAPDDKKRVYKKKRGSGGGGSSGWIDGI